MKNKILFILLCLLPMGANAAIPYRVEQINMPAEVSQTGNDDEAFASRHRFYVGGTYTFSMWNNDIDGSLFIDGKNTSSFDAMVGIRIFDTFRLEADYARTVAEWDAFKVTGDTAMLNAIFDARIDSLYRLFYKQHLVPYVGVGGGASWNSAEGASIENKISPVASVMAGLGIELGEHFALDFGYRYLYMFAPKFDVAHDLAPIAHQLRVGARINF